MMHITSAPNTEAPLDHLKRPMNYDNDDLQPSSPFGIDSTSLSSSSEERSPHPITPPRGSGRTNCRAPKQLGYSPRKFGNDPENITKLKEFLHTLLKMKDLG